MKPRNFDDILDQCLGRLQAGASIDDCVAGYPEHADELREQLSMAQTLQSARPHVQPEPAAQSRGRARVLSAVAEQRESASSRPGVLFFGLRLRMAMVSQALPAVVALLILGGTAAGFAAATGNPDPTAPIRGLFQSSDADDVNDKGTDDENEEAGIDDDDEDSSGPSENSGPGNAGDVDDGDDDDDSSGPSENSGPGNAHDDDEGDEVDNSGPGNADDDDDATLPTLLEVRLEGVITAVQGQQITVFAGGQSWIVMIGSTTEIRGEDGENLSVSDLMVGDGVEVRGHREGDGPIQAERVELEDDPDDEVDVNEDHSGSGSGDDDDEEED